jgi:hypothetical protein
MTIIHCDGHEFEEVADPKHPFRCIHCNLKVSTESSRDYLEGKKS